METLLTSETNKYKTPHSPNKNPENKATISLVVLLLRQTRIQLFQYQAWADDLYRQC